MTNITTTLPSEVVNDREYGPDNSVIETKRIVYYDSQSSKDFWESICENGSTLTYNFLICNIQSNP